MTIRRRQRNGFSLIELSIVLVILGLLVGGILSGRALIRASELRSVTLEREQLNIATSRFKEKYFALPGDMADATKFWPQSTDCSLPDANTTCDGNNNGYVESPNADNIVYETNTMLLGLSDETTHFWIQLVDAGLIEVGPLPTKLDKDRGWVMMTLDNPSSGWSKLFDAEYKNMYMYPPLLLPEEIWNIDTKIDDGKPGMGKMMVWGTLDACTDVTGSDAVKAATLSANYLLSGTARCGIIFRDQL